MQRMLVVLNARAGRLMDLGPDVLRHQVEATLARDDLDLTVTVVAGAEMTALIREAPQAGFDTVVVGAGDGTLSFAAAAYAHTDMILGVLPLGTMNLLAYDIGIPRDLEGALAALAQARPLRVDLGTLNGRPFHGVSGVGFFSQMALAREQERERRGSVAGWLVALFKAAFRSGRLSLEVELSDMRQPIEAYAALVTVNAFDAPALHRSRLDGGRLEVLVAEDRGALARLRAGAEVLIGNWRDNPGIHAFSAQHVTIHARRRRAWVATDGEVRRESLPLRYAIAPGALRLLVPLSSPLWRAHGEDDIT